MACNNCYPQPCNCTCPSPCPDPLNPCPDTGCVIDLNSSCVTYDGNNVDCAGIAAGQTLNQVVEELGTTVCQLFNDVTSFSNFKCTDLSGCSIDALGDVNTTSAVSGDVLIYNGTTWVTQAQYEFACSELNGCSINSLGDVITTSAVSGSVLVFNGTNWVSGSQSAFQCSDLNSCSIDSLGDVVVPLAVSGDTLTFNGATWVNTPTFQFSCNSLSGCSLISIGNVSGDSQVSGNTLVYNGSNWVGVSLPESFSCTDLSGCSINSLADVDTTSALSGNILIYNGTDWVDADTSVITQPLQDQIDVLENSITFQQVQINNILAQLECFCISGVTACCDVPTGECSALTFTDTTLDVCYAQPGSVQGKLEISNFDPTPSGDIASIAGVTGVALTTDNYFKYIPIIPTDSFPYTDLLTMTSNMTTDVKNGSGLTGVVYIQFTDVCGATHTASFTFVISSWANDGTAETGVCFPGTSTTYEIDPV